MVFKSFAQFAKSQAINLKDAVDADITIRAAAIVVAGEVKRRVENEGKDSSGSPIKTRAKEKYGAYSKGWGEKRAAKGRQTSIIDLNYTGDMWKSWLPVPTEKGWGATFVIGKQLDKAEENTKLFGPIFNPTKTEEKIGLAEINRQFKAIMKRKSA